MTTPWTIPLADETATERLGAGLSLSLEPGDTITLSGGLGAGKTTFARALIRAVAGDPGLEVPSPTFTLVQTYADGRLAVAHFDLYRITDVDEVAELGLDDALETGAALIEWPDRIDDLPPDRLEITLAETEDGGREARLSGHGVWAPRLDRLRMLDGFLARACWSGCTRRFLQGDASSRRYERLAKDGQGAILMDMAKKPDGPPIRGGRPYSAIARLADNIVPFVAMDAALRDRGLSAPEIHAADLDHGFALLEDLGDAVYGRLATEGADMDEPYRAAVDLLVLLRDTVATTEVAVPGGGIHRIPPYDRAALGIETELVMDWLWPRLHGAPAPAHIRARFAAIWTGLFVRLDDTPPIWTLRDYHSPNLIWLPDRSGPARVGLLDFQDTVIGHPAYDLMSLLQDARIDVDEHQEAEMLARYCHAAAVADPGFDEERFRTAYAVLGAQRATKLLGIFVRLAERDGKLQYLRHLPRVSRYLERNLVHPALADIKTWYDRHLPVSHREEIVGIE